VCAESFVERSDNNTPMVTDRDLVAYINKFVAKYGPTYLVSVALQDLFYISEAARKRFVDRCEGMYAHQVTFHSYLCKTVQGNDPLGDSALLGKTLSSLAKNNLSKPSPMRELV